MYMMACQDTTTHLGHSVRCAVAAHCSTPSTDHSTAKTQRQGRIQHSCYRTVRLFQRQSRPYYRQSLLMTDSSHSYPHDTTPSPGQSLHITDLLKSHLHDSNPLPPYYNTLRIYIIHVYTYMYNVYICIGYYNVYMYMYKYIYVHILIPYVRGINLFNPYLGIANPHSKRRNLPSGICEELLLH